MTEQAKGVLTPKSSPSKSQDPKAESSAVAPRASRGDIITGSFADEMEAMAGAGLENVTAKDLLIPRIAILQSLSYQLQRTRPQFMPDAKKGMFCDVGLNELLDSPLTVVPVYFITQYLEWLPGRKGLAGIHDDPSILAAATPNEKRQPVLPNGNLIQETAQFYSLLPDVDMRRCFIPMASTQLKKARTWNTYATSEKLKRRNGEDFTPPMFYRSYKLTSVPESNDSGEWDGWKIERDKPIEQMENGVEIFKAARDFLESIVAGRTKADLASMANEPEIVGSSSTKDAM